MPEKTFVDKVIVMMRHYREAAGLSQSEVADALRIGLRSYQRYEAGDSIPSIDIMYLVSKVLNFELKEIFSSADHREVLKDFKIFTREEAGMFLNDPVVVDSRMQEIFESQEFKKVLETGDLKLMKENELFMSSPFKLTVANPKHSFLNQSTQKLTGLSNEQVPTSTGHDDLKELGTAWANLMDKDECYFQHLSFPQFPKGTARMMTKAMYRKHNGNYIVLCNCDIQLKKKIRKADSYE